MAARSGSRRVSRIAGVLIEFMAVREAYGSARFSLDRVAAEVDAAIKRGQCGLETKALFNDFRNVPGWPCGRRQWRERRSRQAGAAHPRPAREDRRTGMHRTGGDGGGGKSRRIARPLRAEPERTRFAQAKLRGDRRGNGRKRRGPIDDCMGTIAAFFDCRVWGKPRKRHATLYFFGLPADVQAAVYLHDQIVLAFASETGGVSAGRFMDRLNRRAAVGDELVSGRSGAGIVNKLGALRKARDAVRRVERAGAGAGQAVDHRSGTGTFGPARRVNPSWRRVISDAFDAGKAGRSSNIGRGSKRRRRSEVSPGSDCPQGWSEGSSATSGRL